MTRLLNLLEYPETQKALEYDFKKHLNITLADVFRGDVTFRQYAAYIKGLPEDSQLVTMLRKYQTPPDPVPIEDLPADIWTTSEHLLAGIANRLERLYQIQLQKSDQSTDGFIKTPGTNANKPKGVAAWIAGLTAAPGTRK